MTYCTQADLVEQYGEKDIRQLSDRVNVPAVAIDADLVARVLADADAEIDLHLEGRYRLPLATVPSSLKRIAGNLAYAALHFNLDEKSPAHQGAVHARKLLDGISTGRLTLGRDALGTAPTMGDTVQISESRNDWGSRW